MSEIYIKQMLGDQLGGWPMLTNKENNFSSIELINRITKFKNLAIFSVEVGANPKNTKYNIIKVKQLSKKSQYFE